MAHNVSEIRFRIKMKIEKLKINIANNKKLKTHYPMLILQWLTSIANNKK